VKAQIATLSSPGGRGYNEDVFGHWDDGRLLACLVADGAGGHGGGDIAAGIVRASVLDGFAARPALQAALLRQLLEQANADIVAQQAAGGSQAHMRSTAVLAVIDRQAQDLLWAHCGDSRAYLFRGGGLAARSSDHSMVQQLVSSGMLDEEGARLHPQRHVLLSALGSLADPPSIDVSPRMRLQAGDALLLCSDGVWEVVGDEGLLKTLQAAGSASQWLQLLDGEILALAKPGHDNFTALAVWLTAAPGDADAERTILVHSGR